MTLDDPGVHHLPDTRAADWYTPDVHLAWLAERTLGSDVWRVAAPALAAAGQLAATHLEDLVITADRNPPRLRQYDARGRRIDEIEFHPAYREIESLVLGFGAVRAGHQPGWRGLSGTAPRVLMTAIHYLFLQADQAITGCPVGMMDAMARCLRRNDAALAARFVPRIAADDGTWLRSAMFLTEKAGGSDVGANETVARRAGDGTWRLSGEKWFASCPHSELALVMARPENGRAGPGGLGLFLMPRTLDDGTRNSVLINRLKDKFGTRSMPSGELSLRDAFAWQVGDLDAGMRQMMDMVSLTRVSIAAAAAGAMRRNAFEAVRHATLRRAFGRELAAHPLMADSLAEIVTDATAGVTAAFAVSDLLDRADAGNAEAAAAQRLLTPLLKGYLTERARITATEAMEVRGGNGYIEDYPDARILRDVSVHAIWEGSSNVMALDVLRAIRAGAAPGFLGDIEREAEAASASPAAAPLAATLLTTMRDLERAIAGLAGRERDAQQLPVRRLARRMAITAISAKLASQGAAYADDTGSGRLLWLAARFASRLGGETAVAAMADNADWLAHAPALLAAGDVPLAIGAGAVARVAHALDTLRPAVNA